MKLLEQGNATMGVWLGKQYLGQSDEIRYSSANTFIGVALPNPPATLTGGTGSNPTLSRIEGDCKRNRATPAERDKTPR